MRSGKASVLPFIILLLLAGTLPTAFQPLLAQSSGVPDGLSRSEPIRCTAFEHINLRDRYIETIGDAVVVNGHCEVAISNSHIVAGDVAVRVEGKGQVRIDDSHIEGARAALEASGMARISYQATTVLGALRKQGMARIDGDDGAVATTKPSAARIRFGAGGIRLETEDAAATIGLGGIKLETDEAAADIGAGGIQLETEDAAAVIAADGIRLRTDDAAMDLGMSAVWRTTDTVYRSSDTERILAELTAAEADGQLNLNLAGDVLFDFSSAAIRSAAATELAKVAHLIRERATGEVHVVGHTDSIGGADANQKLSEERALAVMRWLHGQEGIPAPLLQGSGLGATKPIDYNTLPDGSDHPAGRARNRRVEIYFAVRP